MHYANKQTVHYQTHIAEVCFSLHSVESQIKCAASCWSKDSASAWPGFLAPDSQQVPLNVKMVWPSSQFPTVGKTE